ncbi:MAG: type II toxin-antitoxin system death-on-curing family toxin [Chloroflexi bacterium]|nr:type II toxin-antitoxin system death-on-curing family toxin [Chloroflexota bacterium]
MDVSFFWRDQDEDFIYLDFNDVSFLIKATLKIFPDRPSDLTLKKGGRELLESSLGAPQWYMLPTLAEKAATLHYSLTMNHAFNDGNKRFAIAATCVFLYFNEAFLFSSDERLEEISIQVADHLFSKEELIDYYRISVVKYTWSPVEIFQWSQDHSEAKWDELEEAMKSGVLDHQIHARLNPSLVSAIHRRRLTRGSSALRLMRYLWLRVRSLGSHH